jgi:hypothetical protein
MPRLKITEEDMENFSVDRSGVVQRIGGPQGFEIWIGSG